MNDNAIGSTACCGLYVSCTHCRPFIDTENQPDDTIIRLVQALNTTKTPDLPDASQKTWAAITDRISPYKNTGIHGDSVSVIRGLDSPEETGGGAKRGRKQQ